MTEQQLREKLQFAYGNMPDATRAAFEHSLTHHRAPETHRSIGLSRMMRIVITAVLMALMLTAVGVAAARFFSVTDVHPRAGRHGRGLSGALSRAGGAV